MYHVSCVYEQESSMFTKEQLKHQILQMGIKPDDTVLIHTSMKAIGEVEGGADTVIDAFIECLPDGLFLVPTHTWAVVGKDQPVYDVRTTVPNIGALPRVAAFRKDGIRSLHVTHSIWAHGKGAEEFIKGEEHAQTPCPVGFAWSRLATVNAKILLLGVNHSRDTFIHSIDELANIPDRIEPVPYEVTCIDWHGNAIHHPIHPHYCTKTDDISGYFINFENALVSQGAQTFGKLGNAEVRIVDAQKCQDVIMRIYSRSADFEQYVTKFFDIPEEHYLP